MNARTCVLFLVEVLLSVLSVENVLAQEYQDVLLAKCKRGYAANEFVYVCSAGLQRWPLCFTVSPSGGIYFPEVGPIPEERRSGIRLHKFDRNGKFLAMLALAGRIELADPRVPLAHNPVDSIGLIAVGPQEEVYLVTNMKMVAGIWSQPVYRYDSDGKQLYELCPHGVNRWETKGFDSIRHLDVDADGNVFVADMRDFGDIHNEQLIVYEFNNEGRLLDTHRGYPAAIAKKIKAHQDKLDFLRQRKVSGLYSVLGPDGSFYYMKLVGDNEWLEFHKVVFTNR